MGYRSLSCGRPAAEQRYILAMLRVFAQLPPERRETVRALIACLAETPEEGRALFGVLVQQKTREAGLAIVPIGIYFSTNGLVKLEIALARGKKLHDKRQAMAERDSKREIARAVKMRSR